jgi:hypothetical protein
MTFLLPRPETLHHGQPLVARVNVAGKPRASTGVVLSPISVGAPNITIGPLPPCILAEGQGEPVERSQAGGFSPWDFFLSSFGPWSEQKRSERLLISELQ